MPGRMPSAWNFAASKPSAQALCFSSASSSGEYQYSASSVVIHDLPDLLPDLLLGGLRLGEQGQHHGVDHLTALAHGHAASQVGRQDRLHFPLLGPDHRIRG